MDKDQCLKCSHYYVCAFTDKVVNLNIDDCVFFEEAKK
jgi:hypothetical protein